MWNQEKPLKITIVWEQNEWGGVDSYLNYLLSDWPCGEDIFTVVYNSENKGAKRLQLSLKNKENINFLEIPSIFEYRPNSKTLSKIYKVLIYLITPLIFVVSSIKYRKIFLNLSPDVVLSQNGGYPGGYGNISAIFGAAWAGVYVRTLVIHHAATKPNYLHGWFRLIMERSLAKVLSSLLTVSEVTKNTILMNTRISDDQVCRIMVIDNGVPISRSAPELNPKKNSDHIVIGILGRLESFSGPCCEGAGCGGNNSKNAYNP